MSRASWRRCSRSGRPPTSTRGLSPRHTLPSTSHCPRLPPPLPLPLADPHPGNLLATRSGDLVYLDFGMMSEAPPSGEPLLLLLLCPALLCCSRWGCCWGTPAASWRPSLPTHRPLALFTLFTAARYAIISHVVHLVNRDYLAMCYGALHLIALYLTVLAVLSPPLLVRPSQQAAPGSPTHRHASPLILSL